MRTIAWMAAGMLAASGLAAQAQDSFDMPEAGTILQDDRMSSGDFDPALPGVSLDGGIGDTKPRGPGGLQNNVGAIGMATPSISSENPRPVQRAGDGFGIPIGTPR